MNETIQFEYKCRRCGEIDRSLETSRIHGKFRFHQCVINGKSLKNDFGVHMVSAHTCKDGGEGVTDLIGYKILEEKD